MAKLDRTITGIDIDALAKHIIEGITSGSISASFEDETRFRYGDVSCIVLVFERYSMIGSNRVSLNVALFGSPDQVQVSAITSGGSRALLWKVNTFGEGAFLDKLDNVLSQLDPATE
ncbi:MAG: hypothetical protein E7Z96_09430 [Actinomycetaceae bacterium]|nr:hypothetical protein [Actinomycetaceae bacterium]